MFTKSSYEVHLYENITVGSEVILVRATDKDSGENKVVEYFFADGSGVELFYIDINSGRITLKSRIDRDPPLNQTMFNITVGFSTEILVGELLVGKHRVVFENAPLTSTFCVFVRLWPKIMATRL